MRFVSLNYLTKTRGLWTCAVFPLIGLISWAWVELVYTQSAIAVETTPIKPTGTAIPAVVVGTSNATVKAFDARFTKDVKPLVQKYCNSCHDADKHKGDVILDKYANFASIQSDRSQWESVYDELESGSMPPAKKPQPTKAEMQTMMDFIAQAVAYRDCSGPRDPGRVTIRRLNREEYNNTIRDLLGVDLKPADDFPTDDTGYGFDTIAEVLSMSPLLAEKYLTAADAVLDKVIVTDGPKSQTIQRDGAKLSNTGGYVQKETAWVMSAVGEVSTREKFIAGEYEIRVNCYATQAGKDKAKLAIKMDGLVLKLSDVSGEKESPETIKFTGNIAAGEHKISVMFTNPYKEEKKSTKAEEKVPTRRLIVESLTIEGPKKTILPVVLPPPSAEQKRLLFAVPPRDGNEEACARKVLTTFATRAFRRPIPTAEVDRLMKIFATAKSAGDRYEKAIKAPMSAVLCSPKFLFRIEPAPVGFKGKVYDLDDYALASRLSYFLWSTMPDDALIAAATAGKLKTAAGTNAEIKRMLADPKAQSLVTNFVGQWLELRTLDEYEADPKLFPEFQAMRPLLKKEVEVFCQSIIAEDKSVLDLIDCNYTFVNEKLGKFYGINGVTGESFKKVPLAADSHRGGILTMAGVLSVTAMPSRTSPVKRGKFILEQILGTPPPAPPPDVPPLSDKKNDVEKASLRVRLEAHRADPTCASCHKKMDPIGFAMENYDAIGRWRDKDGGFAIDPSGVLPNGKKIAGMNDLKKSILDKKDGFVRCLVTKMLTYSLGRGIEPSDQCTVDDICNSVKQNNYRFSSILTGIVNSDAFKKRRME